MTDPKPLGLSGSWNLVFRDEFSDEREDAGDKWTVTDWKINNIVSDKKNVWTYGGNLVLNLASAGSGVNILAKAQRMLVGMIVEARIRFPGSGDIIYNWPAFWTAGVKYPESGEIDIAEGLGKLKVSYWSGSKELLYAVKPPGLWAGEYHTFTMHRGKSAFSVRWDGKLVARHETKDDGGPQYILLTLGSRGAAVIDKASRVRVAYVRAWKPA